MRAPRRRVRVSDTQPAPVREPADISLTRPADAPDAGDIHEFMARTRPDAGCRLGLQECRRLGRHLGVPAVHRGTPPVHLQGDGQPCCARRAVTDRDPARA